MPVKTLVLGCGPAGLIAANAAVLAGSDVKILSKPRKSIMNGAQYLHQPIPGVNNGEPFDITYQLIGTPESYRLKVYGPQWDGTVSPEDLEESHEGYDIRLVYDMLWNIFRGVVHDWSASPAGLKEVIEINKPDLVVSTIPANLLCSEGHTFRASKIYSTDRAVQPLPADNFVICNGDPDTRWYRISSVRGFQNTEWPDGVRPPVTPLWEVLKPLGNNCNCFPDVVRGGRYGNWTKGVLSHEIGEEVARRCLTFLENQ